MNKLNLLTLNTFGMPFISPYPQERLISIAEHIQKEDIHIVNFQEVHTYKYLRILQKNLLDFPYVSYQRSLIGVKGGIVTFSKFPLENTEFIPFQSGRRIISSMLSIFDITEKGVLITKLKDTSTVIINTHMMANKDNDWSVSNRYYVTHKSQLTQLAKILKFYIKEYKLVVTSGDFNIAKDSDLYTQFIKTTPVMDAFAHDFEPTYHKEFLPTGGLTHCIDYIFYFSQKNVKKLTTTKLFKNKVKAKTNKLMYISDHIGLLAKFIVN